MFKYSIQTAFLTAILNSLQFCEIVTNPLTMMLTTEDVMKYKLQYRLTI